MSYSQEVIQNDNENELFEDSADDDSGKDLYDDSEDDSEPNNANKEDKVENVSANKKKAIVVKPHKKRKILTCGLLHVFLGGVKEFIFDWTIIQSCNLIG